jgi:hypothetical protein
MDPVIGNIVMMVVVTALVLGVGGAMVYRNAKSLPAAIHNATVEAYGLLPNEQLVVMPYVGEVYFGPLLPGSDPRPPGIRGWATEVAVLTVGVAFTSLNRLIITKEPRGYRPFLALRPDQERPRLLTAAQAFEGHAALAHAEKGPERYNARREVERLQLAQLILPDGGRFTFWCEAAGLAHMHAWCRGGA